MNLSPLILPSQPHKSHQQAVSPKQKYLRKDEPEDNSCFKLDCLDLKRQEIPYNGLRDKHLSHFLSKPSTLLNLKKTGMISKYKHKDGNLLLFESINPNSFYQRVAADHSPIIQISRNKKDNSTSEEKPLRFKRIDSNHKEFLNNQSQLGKNSQQQQYQSQCPTTKTSSQQRLRIYSSHESTPTMKLSISPRIHPGVAPLNLNNPNSSCTSNSRLLNHNESALNMLSKDQQMNNNSHIEAVRTPEQLKLLQNSILLSPIQLNAKHSASHKKIALSPMQSARNQQQNHGQGHYLLSEYKINKSPVQANLFSRNLAMNQQRIQSASNKDTDAQVEKNMTAKIMKILNASEQIDLKKQEDQDDSNLSSKYNHEHNIVSKEEFLRTLKQFKDKAELNLKKEGGMLEQQQQQPSQVNLSQS